MQNNEKNREENIILSTKPATDEEYEMVMQPQNSDESLDDVMKSADEFDESFFDFSEFSSTDD
jgi:hypothetical protein